MSFIKRAKEPPKVKVGEVVEASIVDVKYPVKSSKFQKENVELYCKLPNSYECRCWFGYYQEPSDRSLLGQLALTLMRVLNKEFNAVDEVLDALKSYGKVYLRCVGHNRRGNLSYPKFKLVADVLPSLQTQLEQRPEGICPNCKQRVTPEARFCSSCGFKLKS